VRTTLTLDEDVAAKLRSEARRSGRSFKETVNDTIRRGLASRVGSPHARFRVKTRDLGDVRPGVTLDNVAELVDRLEGPLHR
jgi:plasmid stability protein